MTSQNVRKLFLAFQQLLIIFDSKLLSSSQYTHLLLPPCIVFIMTPVQTKKQRDSQTKTLRSIHSPIHVFFLNRKKAKEVYTTYEVI